MQQPVVSKLSPEDMAAFRRCHNEFSRLIVSKDFDALSRLYAEDAVLMPPNHPAVQGRSAIREWMTAFPPLSQFTTEINNGDVRDDLAYVQGSFSMVFQPEGSPSPVEEIGKYLEVRRRQPDGTWLLVADIFNSDK